jgi:hypothetical protein
MKTITIGAVSLLALSSVSAKKVDPVGDPAESANS